MSSKQQSIILTCKMIDTLVVASRKTNVHCLFHRLPDVGEEATIHFEGQELTINVGMLIEIKKLGSGNYGSVMLVEVKKHPEIKM